MGLFGFFKKKKSMCEQSKEKSKNNFKTNDSSVNSPFSIKAEIKRNTVDDVIRVEERLEGIKPNEVGLYPHEILLLSYAPHYIIGENSFQGFWWYKYGIQNVNKSLQSLLDRGFLRISSLKSAIEKETSTILKGILKDNNLKVSGKKADLVQRLLDEVPEEKLKLLFTKYTYELTNIAEEVLKKEEYILYIHRNSIEGLNVWSLSKMIQERPGYPYRDVIWGYLNQRCLEHISNRNYGLYRNCRLSMYEFLKEERKTDNAFTFLAEVICYDLSGLTNGFSKQYLNIHADSFFPYNKSRVTMAPGITNRIKEYKNDNGISDEDLSEKLQTEMEKIKLPFRLFTTEECIKIVLLEMHNDEEGLVKIYDEAKKRFNK